MENCEKGDQSKTSPTNNKTQMVNGFVSRTDGHQATANTTNGNALTIGGDNPGIIAGGNVTVAQLNLTSNNRPPQSENAKKEKLQIMVNDLAAKLEMESQLYKKSAKKNCLHDVKVQIVAGNMQHWNYCKSEMDRQKISEEINSQSKNYVEITKILDSTNNDIVIIGPPMVGKTNLVQTIGESFPKGKFKFVFYVDFIDLKNVENIDCLQFLTNNRELTIHMENKNDRREIIDYLAKNQENILVVLDHLELVNLNQCKNQKKLSYFKDGKPINFFLGIISGLIFGNSKKVFVSRPCNLEWMYRFQKFEFKPDVYNVLYTKTNILDLYLNQLSDDKKKLMKDPFLICEDIWSFLNVPCIFELFSQGFINCNLSVTLSFAFAFLQFYTKLVDENIDNLFEELVEFTWSQFHEKKKLCIQISPEKLNSALYKSLFVTLPVKFMFGVNENVHKSHMLHILIHEFLIALKVVSFKKRKFKNFINKSVKETNLYFVNNFICDFCCEDFSCVLEDLPEKLKNCLKSKFFVNIETHKKSLSSKLQCLRKQFKTNAYHATQ